MNVTGLAHVGINATDPDAWLPYATEVLGLAPADDHGEAVLRLRMDERSWRVAVHQAQWPGLAYVGWEVANQPAFENAVLEVEAAGITVKVDDGTAAGERSVRGLATFTAPGGHQLELVHGTAYQGQFVSPLGVDFVTGALGMGHVVLTVPPDEFEEAMAFYLGVMGFRVSEHLDFAPVRGALLHCGPRHHSLGVVAGGSRPGCDHLMFEVHDPDDVGRCWDRVLAAGIEIRRMIGRHSDDHMFSFYSATPSKIGIEYGSGGRLIDPATWSSETLRSPAAGDVWGHQPPSALGALLAPPPGATRG